MLEKKAILLLLVISFAVGAYAYARLPEISVTHWNAAGEADGYSPRIFAAFLLPAVSAILALLLLVMPSIDPLRANIEAFKTEYFRFCIAILLFLLLVHVQAMLWNMGTRISMALTIPVLLGAFIFYLGTFLGKAKQNWSVGIRTPWTLSSPIVWEKTHAVASKLFMAAGVVCVLSVFVPDYSFAFVLGSILAAAMASIVYSYFAYSRK